MNDLLDLYPVVIEQPVAWGDMDRHGHVNNVWIFRYIENARIAYYENIGKYDFERDSGKGFILAATTCKFISPLIYPDIVRVGASIRDITEDRAVMHYRLVSINHKRIAAEAQATLVSFDHKTNQKIAFADELRLRISDLEGKLYK